jgi:hypothetical protein
VGDSGDLQRIQNPHEGDEAVVDYNPKLESRLCCVAPDSLVVGPITNKPTQLLHVHVVGLHTN